MNPSDRDMLKLSINNIPLSGGYFNGRFFNGRTLTLDGTCTDESKVIKGWTVVAVGTNGQSTTTNIDGSKCTYTPASLSRITINAIIGESTGIDDIFLTNMFNVYAQAGHLYVESETSEDITIYDINGRQILQVKNTKNADTQVRRGVYIIKCGDKSKKIVVE